MKRNNKKKLTNLTINNTVEYTQHEVTILLRALFLVCEHVFFSEFQTKFVELPRANFDANEHCDMTIVGG